MSGEDALESLRRRIEERLPSDGYGIECEDGWLMLLGELDHGISRYDPWYRIAQVKAKFGTLRFYTELSDELTAEAHDAINALIREAEERSSRVCERCGADGSIRRGGWIRVRCDECEDSTTERSR
jgi:hypothetical protein